MKLAAFSLCGPIVAVAASVCSFVAPTKAQSMHAVATNVPGVSAFAQPPAGFNPLAASPDELASWGYPPRPAVEEGPAALARWSEAVSPSLKRVTPGLAKHEGVFHRPATGLKLAPTTDTSSVNVSSSNWSGYALTPPAGASPFYKVEGRWTVPTVKQPPGICSGSWDYSSHWIGVGGFSDSFLLQAGSEADVSCTSGKSVTQYYPWLEWLPSASYEIYNGLTNAPYPFQPGDYLIVYVWATNWSGGASTTGNLLFEDITQGWSASLTFGAASVGGSKVTGQSAEWIVERPQVNGALATLPDYFANPWWSTLTVDLGGATHYPGSPGASTPYKITMLDNSNSPVSFVSLLGAQALWFFPEGSATQ